MERRFAGCWVVAVLAILVPASRLCGEESNSWSPEVRAQLLTSIEADLKQYDARLQTDPRDDEALSRRGDCHFYLGHFDAAVADYSAMIQLNPDVAASHWRRGIALFYAQQYAEGAAQFEQYHSVDNVDRENGIWRYFCQVKAVGKEQAQAELLRYEKDDREPFPDVYQLFSGELTAAQVIERVSVKPRSPQQQLACEFYAHLYIGLNAVLEENQPLAIEHLTSATANPWGRTASYGPRYMWHVGRLQLEALQAAKPAP